MPDSGLQHRPGSTTPMLGETVSHGAGALGGRHRCCAGLAGPLLSTEGHIVCQEVLHGYILAQRDLSHHLCGQWWWHVPGRLL